MGIKLYLIIMNGTRDVIAEVVGYTHISRYKALPKYRLKDKSI